MSKSKRFGAEVITQNQPILLFTATTESTVCVLKVLNQDTSNSVNVSIAYIDGSNVATLSGKDYIVRNETVAPTQQLEIKGLAVQNAHSIIIETDGSNVTALAYGFE